MKNLKFFAMAASCAAFMLTGCNSDEPMQTDSTPEAVVPGISYMTLNINLPSTDGTRSDEDGATDATGTYDSQWSYNDGTAEEYTISKAELYVYLKAGKTENDYQIIDYVPNLEIGNKLNKTVDGITTSNKVLAQLHFRPEDGQEYYALVLVNRDDDNVQNPARGRTVNTDKSEYDFTGAIYPTFGSWKTNGIVKVGDGKTLCSESMKTSNGFYMANALRWTSTTGYWTLEKIDSSKIYTSIAEAQADTPASEVYVERGLAKLSVENNNDYWQDPANINWAKVPEIVNTTANYEGAKVAFIGWSVDNIDQTSYPIHNIDGLPQDEKTQMESYQRAFYGDQDRVNWAVTPRYFGKTTTPEKNQYLQFTYEGTGANGSFADLNAVSYIPENCQTYSSMYKSISTRIVFKAVYKPAKLADDSKLPDDFFTNGSDGDKNLYVINGQTYDRAVLLSAIKKELEGTSYTCPSDDKIKFSKIVNKTSAIQQDETNGTFTAEVFGENASAEMVEYLNNQFDTKIGNRIQVYTNGICYYQAIVRHFGDTYTQVAWDGEAYIPRHLGRFGIVRNHWYAFDVSSVNLPGTPYVPLAPDPNNPDNPDNPDPNIPEDDNPTPPGEDPTVPDGGDPNRPYDEPDDVLNQYFSFTVHVMAWTKHNQGYNL